MRQKGGLDALLMVPKFKYTFDEERKLFINCLYPYSDYFLNMIREINWNAYSYNGPIDVVYSEYRKPELNIQPEGSTEGNKPVCYFLGGTVYEILNQKFKNSVDYHNYADATSDIDVSLYLPRIKLKDNNLMDEYVRSVFINENENRINHYYNNFIEWTFNQFFDKVKSVQMLINQIPNIVEFEIDEYIKKEDLPLKNKTKEFGYRVEKLGKFYIISFINGDNTMFKIQLVCKLQDGKIGGTDHAIEIIIGLPDENEEGPQPTRNKYNPDDKFDIVTIGSNNFSIQTYNTLISDNLSAYKERAIYVGNPQKAHKAYNHVARLFYLYELLYKNINNNVLSNQPIYPLRTDFLIKDGVFKYYKFINNDFVKIDVPMKNFADAYFKLFLESINLRSLVINAKKTKAFNDVILNFEFNGNKIILTDDNLNQLTMFHDKFIEDLFNDKSYISGGKRRKKSITKRNKRGATKKNKNKKTIKRKRIITKKIKK
jgi:hypothetical protein